MIPPLPTPEQARRLRTVLATLVLLALASVLLVGFVLVPHGRADIVRLELAGSGPEFKAALLADWQQEARDPAHPDDPDKTLAPLCDLGLPHAPGSARSASFGLLRCNLFVDSLGLVPAYVGLLVYFTLGFAPLTWGTVWRHLCCGAALAAGLFDIAENGMTARALDDLIHFVLADATVADVRHASQAKWLLLALACAVLGHLLFWHGAAAGDRAWPRLAALLFAAATPLLVAGTWGWRPGIGSGMLAMVAALALLTWRQWRLTAPGAAA
jgi:hypothetical protein